MTRNEELCCSSLSKWRGGFLYPSGGWPKILNDAYRRVRVRVRVHVGPILGALTISSYLYKEYILFRLTLIRYIFLLAKHLLLTFTNFSNARLLL
jgi:hypothetical protein